MAKNIKNINVTDQVKALRQFSAKNPYGETFLDKMMTSLVTTFNKYDGRSNVYMLVREDIDGKTLDSNEVSKKLKEDKIKFIKRISMNFSDLNHSRYLINSKGISGGFIPINKFDSVELSRNKYCGGTLISNYFLVQKENCELIDFYKNIGDGEKKSEPDYTLNPKGINGIRIELINEFDESLFFSGFVNALKHNMQKNDVESDDFMISECVYNFMIMMYRNFKINYSVEVDNEIGCYNFSTSLYTKDALFADIAYRHQYLYDLDYAIRMNSFYYEPEEEENGIGNRTISSLSMLGFSPIDLSWELFDETSKVREYVKKHLVFFKSLASHTLDDK